jgi:hypothetical protein
LNVHDGNYDSLFIETAEYDDGFAKIVHCHQPPHRDPLVEEADGSYPVNDSGISLGWDDEQILIWYMRQLMIDSSVTSPEKDWMPPLEFLVMPLMFARWLQQLNLKIHGNH